jgi:hypothetical protein
MNIKLFLTIKACYRLPEELTEKIWSIVETDAKKTIQEKVQDMYHRKIEIVRQMFLRLDTFSKSRPSVHLENLYTTILAYARVANYMYMQDTERYIRNLYIIKWRYYDRYLSLLIDKIVNDITNIQLIGKARMARLLALRTTDYSLSTKQYIDITLSPIVMRMITIVCNSVSDIKIPDLDITVKFYFDKIQNRITDTRYNPLDAITNYNFIYGAIYANTEN